MSKKIELIALVILAFALNACVRPTTQAPAVAPAAKATPPQPLTTPAMSVFAIATAQTALALMIPDTPTLVIFAGLVALALLFFLLLSSLVELFGRHTRGVVSHAQAQTKFTISPFERRIVVLNKFFLVLIMVFFYLVVAGLILGAIIFAAVSFVNVTVVHSSLSQVDTIYVFTACMLVGMFLGVLAILMQFISPFFLAKGRNPGRPLKREEADDLWLLAEQVARDVGTQPFDAICVQPDTSIRVVMAGTAFDEWLGSQERVLILGLALLNNMTVAQLKAILAHEYAHLVLQYHWSSDIMQDWAESQFGGWLRAADYVAKDSPTLGQILAEFAGIFLIPARSLSRLQEAQADRLAIATYGGQVWSEALLHLRRQPVLFNYQLTAEVLRAKAAGRSLKNLYALPPIKSGPVLKELNDMLDARLNKSTSLFDTHLAIKDRLKLCKTFPTAVEIADQPMSVWSLFKDPKIIQMEMTVAMRERVKVEFEWW